jgi:hypothetical protein
MDRLLVILHIRTHPEAPRGNRNHTCGGGELLNHVAKAHGNRKIHIHPFPRLLSTIVRTQPCSNAIPPGSSEDATRGFGVSAWYRLYRKSADADALLREIVERDPEQAFGRIAAEVDHKRAAGG